MRTRSSRRIIGLDPEMPPELPPPPPPVECDVTYNSEKVPPSLLNKTIQSCSVEILNCGEVNLLEDDDSEYEEKIKNHVVLSLLFRREIAEGTSDAPSGTTGVRIAFDIVGSAPGAGPNEKGGELRVRTITYSNTSLSAVKVFNLQLGTGNLTLRQFVRPPITQQMTNYFFVFNGRGYMGCRDWITQYIRVLDLGNLVNPSLPNNETVYRALCHRYLENGDRVPKPVERGRFGTYQRHLIQDIIYV